MKVMFLDIDGVLNNMMSMRLSHRLVDGLNTLHLNNTPLCFDPACVSQALRIQKETKCSIVVTSSWRHNWSHCLCVLRSCGFDDIIGLTPSYLIRDDEIKGWLKDRKDVHSYVIVDDYAISDPDLKPNFVATSYSEGLTAKAATEAIEILNKGEVE